MVFLPVWRNKEKSHRNPSDARCFPDAEAESLIIIKIEAPEKVAVKAARKTPTPVRKAVKEYPPHEHFGSPTNVCRVCGEKYSYVAKPYAHAPK